MTVASNETCVVATRFEGRIRWFRCDRDLWVLDVTKWRNEFIWNGYDVPDFNDSYRFGIKVIDDANVPVFLGHMREFEVSRDCLAIELAKRYTDAASWWDVKDLFPIMFVDFDRREVGAFYPDGVPMERYIPDGWVGRFIDFANEYPEEVFPMLSKFWIKDGIDLLLLLNKRGAEVN